MGRAPLIHHKRDRFSSHIELSPYGNRKKAKRRKILLFFWAILLVGLGTLLFLRGNPGASEIALAETNVAQIKPPEKLNQEKNQEFGLEEVHKPADFGTLFADKSSLRWRQADRVRRGESLASSLGRLGVSAREIHYLAKALKKKVNLRGIQPGDAFVLEGTTLEGGSKEGAGFESFEIIQSNNFGIPVRYRVERNADIDFDDPKSHTIQTLQSPILVKRRALGGKITSSLYEGVMEAGGDPVLVNRFADLFGWQLDFYRETRAGDTFKVIAEENYVDGRFVGYGRVVAAEYAGSQRSLRGFYFSSDDEKIKGVYDEKGESLEKTFLKSPLELAKITSRYGQRFHPVLKRHRKHNGIDYGAPPGTPFWSVADGVVKDARYSRTAGKMIRLRHLGGYETEYFHLSKFAPGIKKGVRVSQRQIIGHVGSTGRSTGPHLHYGMLKNGRYVNPGRQNFPAGKPVPKAYIDAFSLYIEPLQASLDAVGSI